MPCSLGRCSGCPWVNFDDQDMADWPVVVLDRNARMLWWSPWFPFDGTAVDLGGERWLEWLPVGAALRMREWILTGCPGPLEATVVIPGPGGAVVHRVTACGESFGLGFWAIGFDAVPPIDRSALGRHLHGHE